MHVRDQLGGEAQGWASVTPPPLRPAGVGTRPWRLNSCNQLNPSRNASTPPLQHSLTHSLTANLPLFHFGSCTYTLRARPQHDWCWEASLDEAAPSWLPIRVWRWEPVVLVLSKRRSKRRRILRRLKETRLKKRRRWRPSRGGGRLSLRLLPPRPPSPVLLLHIARQRHREWLRAFNWGPGFVTLLPGINTGINIYTISGSQLLKG